MLQCKTAFFYQNSNLFYNPENYNLAFMNIYHQVYTMHRYMCTRRDWIGYYFYLILTLDWEPYRLKFETKTHPPDSLTRLKSRNASASKKKLTKRCGSVLRRQKKGKEAVLVLFQDPTFSADNETGSPLTSAVGWEITFGLQTGT